MATRKKPVCIEEETLYKSLQEQTKAQKLLLDDCKRGSYKYGPENKSLLQLLEIIKEKNVNEVHNFIKLFPETGSKGIKITQSHVFEALWNLIFIFQKDNLKGEDEVRKFYKKLESMEKQTDDIEKILAETLVNESKKSGIADTFFEHKEKTHQNKCPKCGEQVEESKMEDHIEKCKVVDCVLKKGDTSQQKTVTIPSCNSSKPIDTSKIKKFLFSAKYFKKEKSVSRYDIQDIFLEAHDKITQFNIILLVKDKEALEVKMTKTEKQLKNRFSKILDINDLDVFYKSLLFDLNNSESIEELFKSFSTKRNKKLLIPRFHQEYFINFTIENLLKKNKKLIWGAVPRSGKSYMIGGLVSKLLNLKKTNPTFELNVKNVIIFLGAISETGKQFEDMFKEFDDFNDFNIINIQNESTKYKSIKTGDDQKNIILISQQQAWYDTGEGEKKTKTESGIEGLLELFSRKDTIVFFDEIHQGSSAKSQAQMNVLNKYIFRKEGIIFPFIMVTATFAKPLKKYLSLGGQESKLIQWRYEDIQYMKNINKPGKYDELIEEIKRMEEAKNIVKHSEVLIKLFNEYESRGISKAHLSKQYLMYPNLTILSPNLEDNSLIEDESLSGKFVSQSKIDIEREVICSIFKSNEKSGFVAENNVIKLLNYIKKQIYDKLLKGRLGFDVYGRKHTQLWFLPTICANNTITKVKSLISELTKLNDKNPKNVELIRVKKQELTLEREKSTNISIEKMTRFLALLLMKDPDFRKKFCVLVIHSQDLKPKKRPMNEDPFLVSDKGGKIHHYSDLTVTTYTDLDNPDLPCVSTKCVGDTNLGRCIEKQEACAHAQDKSLIILTGMRLRLGISLPCVDIALHMDPLTSVDTIYQSMFRVLTERPGKETGYFIDLLSERLVNFIYEYDNYTNKSNKTIDLSSRKKRIIEKLFSFNLNGLNDLKENTTFGKVYGKLSANLKLDDDIEFYKRSMSLEEDSIKSMLSDLETINTKLFNEFYKGIKFLNIDYSKVTREQIETFKRDLYERKPRRPRPKHEGNNDNGNNDNGNNDGNHNSSKKSKEEPQEKKQIQMINYIKDIFSLVVLFEHEVLGIDEDDFTCDPVKVKELLLRDLSYEITETDLEKLCSENSKIIDCHITHIKNLKLDTDSLSKLNDGNKANLIEMINLYRLILTKFIEGLNEAEIGELFKLYCLIKDSIVHLKKNIDKQYDIHKMKCIEKPQKAGVRGKKTTLESTSLVKNETVLETIRKYLSVREEEKKLFGEVFTPIELVCEMLDKLPASVWTDPTLKWLDPANGIGNYPVVCYYKLMEGLKTVTGYEDEKTRSKHIIEKMLFMVELNPVNVKVCRKVFKMIDPNAITNIYNKDFLLWSADEIKKGNKYDIIMGNPPYNKGWEGRQGGVLWKDFVFNSIELLQKNGFLMFVHPLGWRKPFTEGDRENNAGRVWHIFKQFNLLFTKISDEKIPHFPKVDYYLFQNKKVSNFKTRVINKFNGYNIDEIIELGNLQFIPNFVSKLSLSILNKLLSKSGDKFNVIYDQNFKAVKKDTKFLSNSTEHYWVPKQNNSYEITYKKYTEIPDYVRTPKVILTRMAGSSALHNKLFAKFSSKPMGTTSATMYQLVENISEGEKYEKYFNSKLLTFLIKITQYTDGQFAKNEFKILNLLSKPSSLKNNPTDEDIYKYYGITKEEQQLIEEVVKDQPETRKSDRTKKASRVTVSTTQTKKASTPKLTVTTEAPPAKPVEKPPSTNANNSSKKVSRVNASVNHSKKKKKASNKTPTAPPSASKPQSSVSGLDTSRTATNTKKSKRCPRGEHKIPCKTGFKEYTHAVKSIKCCRKDI